eukprot:364837-Chlamydomonas_euryale.AAC.12
MDTKAYMCVCMHAYASSGLVNGALCNDCDLTAEDMEVIASVKASVKSTERESACMYKHTRTTAVHVTGFLGTGWTGLVCIPWGLHGRAHAFRWDFQHPWPAQALIHEATFSRGVLLSCMLTGALCNN